MNEFILIGSVVLIHLVAWLTPGPNIVLIIRNSLIYSRKAAFFTAIGFAISNYVHIVIAVTGVNLIIERSPFASSIIKFLGVGYLIYLGVKTIVIKIDSPNLISQKQYHDISPFSAIKTGFITSVLSPKAPLFFGSIFGTLLSSGTPTWIIIFLIIEMPFNTVLMANLWSFLFIQRPIKDLYARFQPIFNKVLGSVLIILALLIILSESNKV